MMMSGRSQFAWSSGLYPAGRSALFPFGLVRYGQRSGVDSMKDTAAPLRLAVIAAALAAAVSLAPLLAQAPAPPDFSKVEIQTSQVAPNFYRFEAVGPALVGNAGILAGPDGIFMVDAQFPQLTEKLTAAIKKVSDRPIRFLVNTHHHPDHTSGDGNFAM